MSSRLPTGRELVETVRAYHSGSAADIDDLVELATRFVELKRALGHRYEAEEKRLHGFFRFLHERGVRRASELSVAAMFDWAASRLHVQNRTWAGELGAVSVFMDHMRSIGKVKNNVCCFLFLQRRWTNNYRPYIYTLDELKKIFVPPEAGPAWKARAVVYSVIYACAMRVSEAARLTLGDFDRAQGTLFIRKSKFKKDRLLPLHPRVLERLRWYCQEHRANAPPEARLFVNAGGQPYTSKGLASRFVHDLKRLGIHRPTREVDGVRYGSPRVHALRHSFAIHRLLKWYREGADVQAMLLSLSTYLGHSDIIHSQEYLKTTGLILHEAHKRFAGRWEKEFPLSP